MANCSTCSCTPDLCAEYSPNSECYYEKEDNLHQSYSHYESTNEGFFECQNDYIEGNWCN